MKRHSLIPILFTILLMAAACSTAGALTQPTGTTAAPLTITERVEILEETVNAAAQTLYDARLQLINTRHDINVTARELRGEVAGIGLEVRYVEAEIDELIVRVEAEEAEIVDLARLETAEANRLASHMVVHHRLFRSSTYNRISGEYRETAEEGSWLRVGWRTPDGSTRYEPVTVRAVDLPPGWYTDPAEALYPPDDSSQPNPAMQLFIPADDDDIANTHWVTFEATGWGGTVRLPPIEIEVHEPN